MKCKNCKGEICLDMAGHRIHLITGLRRCWGRDTYAEPTESEATQ